MCVCVASAFVSSLCLISHSLDNSCCCSWPPGGLIDAQCSPRGRCACATFTLCLSLGHADGRRRERRAACCKSPVASCHSCKLRAASCQLPDLSAPSPVDCTFYLRIYLHIFSHGCCGCCWLAGFPMPRPLCHRALATCLLSLRFFCFPSCFLFICFSAMQFNCLILDFFAGFSGAGLFIGFGLWASYLFLMFAAAS